LKYDSKKNKRQYASIPPLGIKILAALQFLAGLLTVLSSLFLTAIFHAGEGQVSFWILIPFVPGQYVLLILGVAMMILAWGLWNLQSWAWIITVGIYLLQLISAIYSLCLGGFFSIPAILTYMLILWYLIQKRSVFGVKF